MCISYRRALTSTADRPRDDRRPADHWAVRLPDFHIVIRGHEPHITKDSIVDATRQTPPGVVESWIVPWDERSHELIVGVINRGKRDDDGLSCNTTERADGCYW